MKRRLYRGLPALIRVSPVGLIIAILVIVSSSADPPGRSESAPAVGGNTYLPLVTRPGPTPLPSERPTSAEWKIQAAIDAGRLDAETGLTYKVYSIFDSSRLPAEYHSDSGGAGTSDRVMTQLVVLFPTLSPSAQANLAPYLKLADEPGSWYELR